MQRYTHMLHPRPASGWDTPGPWSPVGMMSRRLSVGAACARLFGGWHVSPGPGWGWHVPPVLGGCGVLSEACLHRGALSVSSLTAVPSRPRRSFPCPSSLDRCSLRVRQTSMNCRKPWHIFLSKWVFFGFQSNLLKVLNIPGTLFALSSLLPLGFSIHLVTPLPGAGPVQIQTWLPAERLRCAQALGT